MPFEIPYRIKTISEFHYMLGLPRPEHPLISLINLEDVKRLPEEMRAKRVLDFYSITLKHHCFDNFKYGQQQYDVTEGIMYFIAPGQVVGSINVKEGEEKTKISGWGLYIHPDFLWNSPLAKTINTYEYFNYSVNEALFLSIKEEGKILNILKNIEEEYHSNIDKFSQDIIISQIETLLNYSQRFYERQFITRKKVNHEIIERFEIALSDYFANKNSLSTGLPTVQFISDLLNISPSYLSTLLKTLTGESARHHIQNKLIEKAKEKISITNLPISEIAYDLGFEHPQSFSKLFKSKTNLSPSEFRKMFN